MNITVLPDIELLETNLERLHWIKHSTGQPQREESLARILATFGFETRGTGNGNLFYKHPEVGGVSGTLLSGENRVSSQQSLADNCLSVYEAIQESRRTLEVGSEFSESASDFDVEADFRKWGEEIEAEDGFVILRSRDISSIGIKVRNEAEKRASEIPKLRSREKAFKAMSYEACNRLGYSVQKDDNGRHVFHNWAHEFDLEITPFSGNEAEPPEALLTALYDEAERRGNIFRPCIEWIRKDSGFYGDPETVNDPKLGLSDNLEVDTGIYVSHMRIRQVDGLSHSPIELIGLCSGLEDYIETLIQPRNLKLLGFEVKKSGKTNEIKHCLFPDIKFSLEPLTGFPKEVGNDSLVGMPPEQAEKIVSQTFEHVRSLKQAFAPVREALEELHTRWRKNEGRVTEYYGSTWSYKPNSNLRSGQIIGGKLERRFGGGDTDPHQVRALAIPNNSKLRDGSGCVPIFHPDDLEFLVPAMTFQKAALPKSKAAPLSNLSGLKVGGIGEFTDTSTSPKPPWLED